MSVAPPLTAVTCAMNWSPTETVVVVKSVTVVLSMCVPVASETPLVLITSAIVGMAVPVAFFHTFKVQVPWSALMMNPVIVPGYFVVHGVSVTSLA